MYCGHSRPTDTRFPVLFIGFCACTNNLLKVFVNCAIQWRRRCSVHFNWRGRLRKDISHSKSTEEHFSWFCLLHRHVFYRVINITLYYELYQKKKLIGRRFFCNNPNVRHWFEFFNSFECICSYGTGQFSLPWLSERLVIITGITNCWNTQWLYSAIFYSSLRWIL